MTTILHIPKTAGTNIKNSLVDTRNTKIRMANSHDVTLKSVSGDCVFFIRDPLERFCSGYWERKTNKMRRELNNKAEIRYRRSGYRDYTPYELAVFGQTSTPDEYITKLRTDPAWLKENLNFAFMGIYVTTASLVNWLGTLEEYKTLEHKVSHVAMVSDVASFVKEKFHLDLHTDPFLARTRSQFKISQSYEVSEENSSWFKNHFKVEDYRLVEYIKQQPYFYKPLAQK